MVKATTVQKIYVLCAQEPKPISLSARDFANKINFPEKYEEFSNLTEYDELEEKYCITDAEIEEKVAKCELLSGEEKKKNLGGLEKV